MGITRTVLKYVLIFISDDKTVPSDDPAGEKLGRVDNRHREESREQECKENDASPRECIVG